MQVPSLLECFSAWLTLHGHQLDASALVAIIPAVRLCLTGLSQKLSVKLHGSCMQQLAGLTKDAARLLFSSQAQRESCEAFLTTWAEEDITALLKACSTAGHAAEGVKAAHAWVQAAPALRQQHWAALLDSVDFKGMAAVDMDGLRRQLKDEPALVLRMFTALLAKQLQVS